MLTLWSQNSIQKQLCILTMCSWKAGVELNIFQVVEGGTCGNIEHDHKTITTNSVHLYSFYAPYHFTEEKRNEKMKVEARNIDSTSLNTSK